MRAESEISFVVIEGGTLEELYEGAVYGAYVNKLAAMERAQTLANRTKKKHTVVRKFRSVTYRPEICVGPEHA